ncbi:hypothetical protein GCM10010417_02600 [Streptomyces carpaticus]
MAQSGNAGRGVPGLACPALTEAFPLGAHSRKCDWCGCGTPIVRDLQPVNTSYQYWCVECARALIIKGDPIEVYRELEGEPIYGRLLDEHCALKRFYSFASA